jgi:hypothetical protein
MHSSTARGFYVMLLNRDEREKLRDYEKTLPRGRYLINKEIALIFHLEVRKEDRNKTPEEITAMDELWQQFNREIWKEKKIVKFRLEQTRKTAIGNTLKPMSPVPIMPKEIPSGQAEGPVTEEDAAFNNWVGMEAEERYNWGEYVLTNYRKPMNSASEMDAAFGMAQ